MPGMLLQVQQAMQGQAPLFVLRGTHLADDASLLGVSNSHVLTDGALLSCNLARKQGHEAWH